VKIRGAGNDSQDAAVTGSIWGLQNVSLSRLLGKLFLKRRITFVASRLPTICHLPLANLSGLA
jgi:hypothetical protein